MAATMTPDVLALALGIFALRVVNYAVSTIRLVFVGRGLRMWAATIAFFEALIFAVVIAQVVADLTNVAYLVAYCLGAAVGSYVGMWLDARFVVSFSTVTVIAKIDGLEIADALREEGFGATVSTGEGRDGDVAIIRSAVVSRDIPRLIGVVREVNADAFVNVEPVSTLRRGWIPGGPARRG